MKFSSYDPSVELNTIRPPQVVPTQIDTAARYDTQANAGNKAWMAAAGQVNKVLLKMQDDQDSADVMEARNKIMTSLMEKLHGEEGLFTLGVGENAKGLMDRTTDTVRETFNEIAGQYNGRVRRALAGNLNENMGNFQRNAAAQEKREREGVELANYKGNLDINRNLAAMSYKDGDAVNMYLHNNQALIAARGVKMGWSGPQLQAETRAAYTSTISGVLDAYIANEDYDGANAVLMEHGTQMDQGTYTKYKGAVKKQVDKKQLIADTEDLITQYTNPDGTINLTAYKDAIEAKWGRNAKRRKDSGNYRDAILSATSQFGLGEQWMGKVTGNSNIQCDSFTSAVYARAGIGSIGGYSTSAEGGTTISDRPFRAAKGTAADGSAYHPVGDGYQMQVGDLLDWGDDQGHVAIYIGDGKVISRQSSAGVNVLSVEEAERTFGGRWGAMKGIGSLAEANGARGGGEEWESAWDQDKLDKAWNMAVARNHDAKQRISAEREQRLEAINQGIVQVGSYEAATSLIDSYDLPATDKARMQNAARSYYGVSRSSGGSSGGGRSSSGGASSERWYDSETDSYLTAKETAAKKKMIAHPERYVGTNEQYLYDEATRLYYENKSEDGIGGDDLDNENAWSLVTHILERNDYDRQATKEILMSEYGFSESEAMYYTEEE